MKHYLVDTNVVIDMLLDREDAEAACAVFDGAERGEYVLHICALSFTTMYYSLRKILTREQRISALSQLREVLKVAQVDAGVIDLALTSGWKDFEDAVQYLSALPYHPDLVITRDKKGFNDLGILVMTPAEFVQKAKE
jgi:predicted nucleic acid-binding protein